MGSHISRGDRSKGPGKRNGSVGGGGPGSTNDNERKRQPKKDKIDKKIDELFSSNKYESVGKLTVSKSSLTIPKNELVAFLLTSINVIQYPDKDRIINNEDFIRKNLDISLKETNYTLNNEYKDVIVDIINNNIFKKEIKESK